MADEDVPVYVDGRGTRVPPGSTALDAVRAVDADEAVRVAAGARVITDSRGLPISADSVVYAGAIYRTSRARREGESTVDSR
jgi:hypothetical protein